MFAGLLFSEFTNIVFNFCIIPLLNTGFYMISASVMKGLSYHYIVIISVLLLDISLKVLDNLCIKILAAVLFHLCLCLV